MKKYKIILLVMIVALLLVACVSSQPDARRSYYTGWYQHCFAIVATLSDKAMTRDQVLDFCKKDLQEAVDGNFYENRDAAGNPIFTIPLPPITPMPVQGGTNG